MKEPNHFRRIVIGWLVLSAIATPIVVAVISPTLPPGEASSASAGQLYDNTVLFAVVTPIACALIVFFAYSLVVFRRRETGAQEGLAVGGDDRVNMVWLVVTTAIVLFLAIFGTVELANAGSGGGQGPEAEFKPADASKALPVQVIAQQWEFTYRFPTYGGIETAHLELPVDQQVEFHVTSLDVIHSFWAPKIGIKADANPGVDNIAFTEPTEEGDFEIHCNELCGLWHGYMFDTGQVVSGDKFETWIHNQAKVFEKADEVLPPYSTHYYPEPQRRAG